MDFSMFEVLLGSWGAVFPILVFLLAAASGTLAALVIRSSKLKYSHKIAVIGFPRSGKTTLISMLFSRIIRSSVASRVRVSGKETIDRVSKYYEIISSGKNIGPSTDKDVFSYRFQYEEHRSYFFPSRIFDVEIADFPGEYSSSIAESKENALLRYRLLLAQPTPIELTSPFLPRNVTPAPEIPLAGLYNSEYQSWVSQADEYIIVVDLQKILENKEEIYKVQAKIFSAILFLKEASTEGGGNLSKKNVALVFSKSDIIAREKNNNAQYAASANYITANEENGVDDDYFSSKRGEVMGLMDEVISFIGSNFGDMDIVFHSSYLRSPEFDEAERHLINFILPGRGRVGI